MSCPNCCCCDCHSNRQLIVSKLYSYEVGWIQVFAKLANLSIDQIQYTWNEVYRNWISGLFLQVPFFTCHIQNIQYKHNIRGSVHGLFCNLLDAIICSVWQGLRTLCELVHINCFDMAWFVVSPWYNVKSIKTSDTAFSVLSLKKQSKF